MVYTTGPAEFRRTPANAPHRYGHYTSVWERQPDGRFAVVIDIGIERSDESQSNYGSILTWWDRLFGTYRAEPAGGQLGMVIGLEELRDPRQLTLARVLWMPISRRSP